MSNRSDLPSGNKTVSLKNDPPSSHGQRPDGDLALRLSNGKLRMALEIGKLGSWEQDVATGEFTGTSTFKAILGLPLDAPINSEQMQQMFHPGDVERIRQAIAYALKTKTDFQIEHRLLGADGHVRLVLARGGAVYEGDKPIRMMGILQDVSNREKVREEIVLAQRRQEHLLELSKQIGNLEDPFAIMEAAARSTAQFLKVDYTGCGEIFEDRRVIVIEREWSKGIFNNEGYIQPFDNIPNSMLESFRAGLPIVIKDTKTDPRTATLELQKMYDAINTRTNVNIAVMRNGQLKGLFYASSSVPRDWANEDIMLLKDVAERTWTAVEKARAERELREMQARYPSTDGEYRRRSEIDHASGGRPVSGKLL